MANVWDYPISTGYGCIPYYPLNYCKTVGGVDYGFHRGVDRAAPAWTPVIVNGITIGWVGSTGASTGPHLHLGRWLNGSPTNPGSGGKILSDAIVTKIASDSVNGNWVGIKDSTGAEWQYLHFAKVSSNIKVGQKLEGVTNEMLTSKGQMLRLWLQFLGREPRAEEYTGYINKRTYAYTVDKLSEARKDLPALIAENATLKKDLVTLKPGKYLVIE